MKTLLLELLLCCCIIADAQRTQPYTEVKSAISFNPLALIQVDYTVLAGYEHRLKPGLFLTTEIGYIFASSYIEADYQGTNTATGFTIRPSIKRFFNRNSRYYIQAQVFYKQVNHHIYDWLGRDAVDNVPSYEQLEHFDYRRLMIGFNGVGGMLVPLNRNRSLYFDFYAGLGIRLKKAMVIAEPNSVYFPRSIIELNNDPDNTTLPSLPIGLRLIFVVK
jgi:hypothetical protein